MGTYTGLRMKIALKDRGVRMISDFYAADLALAATAKQVGWKPEFDDPWRFLVADYPELEGFAGGFRSGDIPGGPLGDVMAWGACDALDLEWGGEHGVLDVEKKTWTFQAGLKNYESDIEKFLVFVLPRIAENVLEGYVQYDLDYSYDESYDETIKRSQVDWAEVARCYSDRLERERKKQ